MVKRARGAARRNAYGQLVFDLLRKRIAEELQKPGLEVKPASQLELAIGTFAPSEMVKGFTISDYPFIGSRYLSVRDGHVYIVAGTTDDGRQVMAYRMGFLQSVLTSQGGLAVGISEDGWMDSVMIMYTLYHASFVMKKGVLEDVNDELSSRRTFPIKKCRAYWAFLRRSFPALNAMAVRTDAAMLRMGRIKKRIMMVWETIWVRH